MTRLHLSAALAVLTLAAPAVAQDAATSRTMTVATADLDLTRPSHVRLLDARIRQAANALCGNPSDFDLSGKIAVMQCREDAAASGATARQAALKAARPVELAER